MSTPADCNAQPPAASPSTVDMPTLAPSGDGKLGRPPTVTAPMTGDGIAVPGYEIEGELGRGGMGVVYLARNVLMDRREVLKVVSKSLLDSHPGAAERFLREIQSAARLDHENVVKAYNALRVGELLVFAMEYVEGEDLAKLVHRQGPLPVAHACHYILQAAMGLQHAHERGMVHRDIKPHNLILTKRGKRHVVKILDFGLAKAVGGEDTETYLTSAGATLGTPAYMAPEQAEDAASADIRTDIYSLGCTLYFLLTGAPPFTGKSSYAVLKAHESVNAPPLNRLRAEATAELAVEAAKMLAKNPAQRYQKPIEVAKAFGPIIKAATQAAKAAVQAAKANPQAAKAKQLQKACAEYHRMAIEREVDLGGGVTMKLAFIPSGVFRMGSPTDEAGRDDNEGPQHQVEITRPFYMGLYPVTKRQFAAFVEDDSYETEAEKAKDAYTWLTPVYAQTEDDPVVCVSWNDAAKFCEWLGNNGKAKCELPTEAQWEYACRAGTTTAYFFGGDAGRLGDYAWYRENSGMHTHPVGERKPNAWGLYDMSGNVWQWCQAYYGPYLSHDAINPIHIVKVSDDARVVRGGSWSYIAGGCRAACRNWLAPGGRNISIGLRICFYLD